MFFDFKVNIPQVKGKVFLKHIKCFQYIHYQYDSVYDPVKKYACPKRTTIGKVCDDDPSMMYPNPNYFKFFPDATIPDVSSSPRSSCLKIGTYLVIHKILHDYQLNEMLNKIMDSKSGLFLDLVAYSIICENNAGQYYPDYAYNHPLFTQEMKIYSDSSVSDFLHSLTEDHKVSFLNEWNSSRSHREKIYISYDSTNKKCQAGDIDFVEPGHSKMGSEDMIFNYSIAYDRSNREPLFYEEYPGSIVDLSQLQLMLEKANAFGYKHIGFILDRGYFCQGNIHYMDKKGYSFIIMMKGMKAQVKEIVKCARGTFESRYDHRISEYGVSGTTMTKPLFPSDQKDRYLHVYYNDYKAAAERAELEGKLMRMEQYMQKHIGTSTRMPKEFEHYFDFYYWHEGQEDQKFQGASVKKEVVDEEVGLCGYFTLITSEKMSAKEALLLYKSRDDSEKLFRGDKSYLGDRSSRVYSNEALKAKILVEFVALIVRNKIYTCLIEEMERTETRRNYMTVPAAIRELEKIEMVRYGNDCYRLDHAVTKTQKTILKAFGIDTLLFKAKVEELSKQLGQTLSYPNKKAF